MSNTQKLPAQAGTNPALSEEDGSRASELYAEFGEQIEEMAERDDEVGALATAVKNLAQEGADE